MHDKLTIKQEKYAQNLFKGMTQREAYKQAYDCQKQSDKSIDEDACVMAANPKVVQRIEQLTNELKERNMVTVEKVLSEMAHIAFDDISNYLDFYEENGETKVKIKDSRTIDTRNVKSVQLGRNGFKFEQYCKDTMLIKLAQTLGMLVEKNDLTLRNPEGESFRIDSLADAEKIIAEYEGKKK